MELNFIKEKVFETVDFVFNGEIEYSDFDGIRVSYDGKKARISSNFVSGYARGFFLLAMNISEGRESFEITEKAHFKSCGVMLDCSRNAVMKPQAVKKYIDCLASLGMNTLLLYTEDTFEVDGRPRFGYQKDKNYENYRYAYLLYSICYIKADLAQNLRASYKAGDRKYLERTRDEFLPELARLLDTLFRVHRQQWLSTYKPFGFEVLTYRYGGMKKRVEAVIETIDAYLDGETNEIPELSQDILVNEGGYLQSAACVMAPSYRVC